MSEGEFEFANPDYDGGETKGHPPKELPKKKSEVEAAVTAGLQANMKVLLKMALQGFTLAEKGYTLALPFINQGLGYYQELITVLEPYGVDEIGTCVTGILLMFFGGSFATLTAVYEAIKQSGFDKFKSQVGLLVTEFRAFRDANAEDDEVDDDGDGIADVEQISSEQYALRKTLLALKATNPDNISAALQSLYTIFIAVVATLRLRFARTLSLGTSIGDQLAELYNKFMMPNLQTFIDEEYHKWLEPSGRYASRFIGVFIAFRIQIILTTFHSALKGGRLLSKGLTDLSRRNNMAHLTDGYLDEILSGVLCVIGIIVQIFIWSSVPIPIRLLLFPLFFLEGLLSAFVGIGLSFTSPKV